MARLSRELIVQTALGLLNDVGYDGLTTRRIAEKLGVKSPALYWHFSNKRELYDAVADAMLAPDEWPGPATPGMSPEMWLAARAHALRRSLLAYRDGALIHAGTAPGPDAISGLDERLSALVACGLSPADGLRILLAISRYTVGWVLEEQAREQRRAGGTMMPDASSPTLLRAETVVRQLDPDADFDFGLQALIAGAMQHRHQDGSARRPSAVHPPTSATKP